MPGHVKLSSEISVVQNLTPRVYIKHQTSSDGQTEKFEFTLKSLILVSWQI